MIEINLLPDIKQEYIRAQRLKRIIISMAILSSIIAGGLVALAIFIVFVVQPGINGYNEGRIDNSLKKLNSDKNLTRNLTIQNQLNSIIGLHEQKGNITNLFEYLKALNPAPPDNLTISKLQLDPSTTTINVEATAGDYAKLTVIKETFEAAVVSYTDPGESEAEDKTVINQKMFSTVEITNTGLGNDSGGGNKVVSFKMTLTYDPVIFDWTLKDQKASVPQKKTTPTASSVNVFSEAPVKKEEVQ